MNNLKIKARLLLCFMGIVLLATITSSLGLNRIRVIDDNYSVLLNDYGFSQGDIGKAIIAITQVNGYTHDLVSFEDENDVKEAKKHREDQLAVYEENIKVVETSFKQGIGVEEYKKAVDLTKKYIEVNNELVKYSEIGDIDDLDHYVKVEHKMVTELNPAYDAAYEALNKLLEIKKTTGDKESVEITKNNSTTYTGILAISIVVLISAIIVALGTASSISNAIKKCVGRIQKLSEGDLKSDVPAISGKDELADLASSLGVLVKNLNLIIEDEKYVLGKMAEGDLTVHTKCDESYVGDFEEIIFSIRNIRNGLSQMLTEIDEAAEQVGVGSEQVASGAQELAQGATEQASAVEELNATIDGIAKEIKANAEQAMDMSNLAISTEKEIEEGNRQMSEMTVAMTEISNTSNKIAKIIKTIDDIAFQTNILALNAAVEAARAGAAGKGFAVVADEVRNLAGKSAEAAKNTTELIESSIKAVTNGTEIADLTANTLSNVVLSAQKTASIVNQMAHSTEEQAKSVEEITKGIEQISAVVQTNSATSEESAAASEELSCQSSKMRDLIKQFTIEKKFKNTVNKSPVKFNAQKINKNNSVKKIQEFKTEEYSVARLEDVQEINLDDFEMDNSMGSKY